jgi:hypothetical protein
MFRWGRGSEKKPVMVMAEPPKAVPATAGSAVHAVEKAKEPAPEGKVEAVAEGEGQGEDDVEELLAQHQELVDSMMAEVMFGRRFLREFLNVGKVGGFWALDLFLWRLFRVGEIGVGLVGCPV